MANNTLEVTKRDGTTARLVHIPTRRFLARAPNGETVEVEARARVISKQKVRAERTCNRMPLVEVEPLRRSPELPVIWATAPLRKIEMPYDREDLDVECTKNVY
jgi:antitoxin (DNA-binding transcriptional repressor) of toxin-antitoxin stability system